MSSSSVRKWNPRQDGEMRGISSGKATFPPRPPNHDCLDAVVI
jgi:hypothetical protein